MLFATRHRSRRGAVVTSEILIKRGALALGLIFIGLAVFATKFTSLDVNGCDYAQVARNLANGRGYTTSAPTPLGMALAPRIDNPPELTRPPAYITVLALAMKIGGANDKTVGVVSLVFLLATAVVLYFVAAHCFGRVVSLWATFLYFVSVPVLRSGISGYDTTFLTFLVTLLFGVLLWLYPPVEDREETAETPKPRVPELPTTVGAGILLALCYLTSYDSLVLLPVVLYFLWRIDRQGFARHAMAVLIPFIILVVPWIVRSSLITGGPFISLHSYEMAMFTDQYPAQTLFRRFDDIPHRPWSIFITSPADMVKKISDSVGTLYADVAQFANPYLTPFFIVGLLLAGGRRRWVLLHGSLALLLVLQAAVLCVYQPLARLLLVYSPIVTALAVYWFLTLLKDMEASMPEVNRRYRRKGVSFHLVMLTLMTVVLLIPLARYLFIGGASRQHPAIETMKALANEPYQYMASDLSWMAAWYGEREALALPLREKDWNAMEKERLTPTALYLSPALLEAPTAEAMQRWQNLLLSGQEFHGMARVDAWNRAGQPGLLLAKGARPAAALGPRGTAPPPVAPRARPAAPAPGPTPAIPPG